MQTVLPNREVRVPRIAIMIDKQVQIDGPINFLAQRDSQQCLRPIRQMIGHHLLVRREQQVVHVPHIPDAVILLVLRERQRHVPGRQVGVERLPCVFPIRDTGDDLAIKHLRHDGLLLSDDRHLKRATPRRDLQVTHPHAVLSCLFELHVRRRDRISRPIRAPHRLHPRSSSSLIIVRRRPAICRRRHGLGFTEDRVAPREVRKCQQEQANKKQSLVINCFRMQHEMS